MTSEHPHLNSREAEDEALGLLEQVTLLEGMDPPASALDRQMIATKASAWALLAVVRELLVGNREH